MTVYVEYALLQNFFFDAALLTLALTATKRPCVAWRIAFSAGIGAGFALVFPLLHLPNVCALLLKISVGILLCLLSFGRIQGRKHWKLFALTCAVFFALTFAIGGGILGLFSGGMTISEDKFYAMSTPAVPWILCLFSVFYLLLAVLIKGIYHRRAIRKNIYACVVRMGEKRIKTDGFFDSGNRACKLGIPVCFLSVDLLFDLVGDRLFLAEDKGQVCDEMQIMTVNGVKTAKLYRGKLEVLDGGKRQKKEVYFSPLANMIAREYKLLINAGVFEERDDENF